MTDKHSSQNIISALPAFRVAGVGAWCHADAYADTVAQLQARWQQAAWAQDLPAFSRSLYCARRVAADGRLQLVWGNLCTPDAILPDETTEIWLPPQQYQVFECNEILPLAEIWQQIQHHAPNGEPYGGFENYSPQGGVRLYIGMGGTVEMDEEIIDE